MKKLLRVFIKHKGHAPLMDNIYITASLKGPFPTLISRPNYLLHEIPWSLKTFQNRLSQEPSWTCSQLFYGKYIRRPSFYSFLTVFWILSGRIRRRIFFKCHVWISSYSVNRVGEKDNLRVFSLSRSTWRFQMKIKYFPTEIGIFQREIWKNIRLPDV